MAVAIKKKVSVPASKTKAAPKVILEPGQKAVTGFKDQVDRLATLHAQIGDLAPVFKEIKKIEEKLRAVAGEAVANTEGAVVVGTKADFVVSACGTSRAINDMKGVRSAMGDKLFMEVAKVTLGDVDKYLTEDQKTKLVTETQEGSRSGKLRLKE